MVIEFINLIIPYQKYSYLLILGILILCGFGVPIPEDITLVVGGILASYNITTFWLILLVSMVGVITGDTAIYLLGRFLGSRIIKSAFFSKIFKARYIAMIRLSSMKYGNYLIFFARFMPGLRTPIFFASGMFKKPFYIFLLIDGFASLISVPIWVYVGMLFGENIPLLEYHIKKMEHGMLFIVGGAVLLVVIFHFSKKRLINYFFPKKNGKLQAKTEV